MTQELNEVEHRPFPLPDGKWIMKQTWEDLLFIHWPVPAHALRPLLPPIFEVDTFAGEAWIGVVPFRTTHQRFRLLPEIPLLNTFSELNVRTYVKYQGVQGVYFFSLDANHPLAVCGAKTLSLPYHHAHIHMTKKDGTIFFKSSRLFAKGSDGRFTANYEPVSDPAATVHGSLDYWLLERYCLFTVMGNHVFRGDIHHKQWNVRKAKVSIFENTVVPCELASEDLLAHYSQTQTTFVWPLKRMGL